MAGKNDAVNESLSALLDGEHGELDLRRVLKAAEGDAAVAKKWSSYQLTREALHRDIDRRCGSDFLAGIQDAISEEPAPQVSVNTSAWQRYASKTAIAACFTFVFLIGASQWSQNSGTNQSDTLVSENTPSFEPMAVVPDGFELLPVNARAVSSEANGVKAMNTLSSVGEMNSDPARLKEFRVSPEQLALLERMMIKHADSSAANGGLGVMPYTRVNASGEASAER